jgi:hypothetical protein
MLLTSGGRLAMSRLDTLERRILITLDQLESLGDSEVPGVSDWGIELRLASSELCQLIRNHGDDDPAWAADALDRLELVAGAIAEQLL